MIQGDQGLERNQQVGAFPKIPVLRMFLARFFFTFSRAGRKCALSLSLFFTFSKAAPKCNILWVLFWCFFGAFLVLFFAFFLLFPKGNAEPSPAHSPAQPSPAQPSQPTHTPFVSFQGPQITHSRAPNPTGRATTHSPHTHYVDARKSHWSRGRHWKLKLNERSTVLHFKTSTTHPRLEMEDLAEVVRFTRPKKDVRQRKRFNKSPSFDGLHEHMWPKKVEVL